MLPAGEPKWRRRKADRPAEIVSAALEVFAEKGFAAAKLDEIARRAGVSKGALYLYYETKQDLFEAGGRGAGAPGGRRPSARPPSTSTTRPSRTCSRRWCVRRWRPTSPACSRRSPPPTCP